MRYKSPLGKVQPSRLNAEEQEAMQNAAYNQPRRFFGIYVDDPRLNWIERKTLEIIGDRIYGKRVTK